MSDTQPPRDTTGRAEILPLPAPIPSWMLRGLVALDAALRDELGMRFSTERWSEEQFTMVLPGKWEFSRVAYSARPSRIIGYWIASLRGSGHLQTHRVGVEVAARRSGIGKALCMAVMNEAAAHGLRTMTLSINEDNEAALRFYGSLGFIPLVDEDLERLVQSKARARVDEHRRRYVLDGISYLALRHDLLGGTA